MIDAYKRYMDRYDNPHTIRKLNQTFDPLLNHVGRTVSVQLVQKPVLLEFINDIKAKDISPHTLYGHVKAVKAFFRFLLAEGHIEKDPTASIKNPRPSREFDEEKAIPEDAAIQVLQVAYGDRRRYALIRFIYDTGCRAMGAAGLTRKRLDLMKRKAVVIEKAGKRYDVYFTEETAQALQLWLSRRPKTDHDHVFTEVRRPYRKLTSQAVSQIIRRLCIKAGIGSYGSHAFRHAMGNDLQSSNEEPVTASYVMGHSNPQTTMNFYYGKSRKAAEAAARRIHARRAEKQAKKIIPLRRSG